MGINFRFINGEINYFIIPDHIVTGKDLKKFFCERISERIKIDSAQIIFIFQCMEIKDEMKFKELGV